MIPLAMIVRDERRDCVPEVPLTDWNDPIETFFLDRPDESLGVSVGRSPAMHPVTRHLPAVFTVTHPFHPLHGQTFELLTYRFNWPPSVPRARTPGATVSSQLVAIEASHFI